MGTSATTKEEGRPDPREGLSHEENEMNYKAKRASTVAEQEVERCGGKLIWKKDGVTLHSIFKSEGEYGGRFYHRYATLTTEEANNLQGKPWPVRCEDIVGEFLLDQRNGVSESRLNAMSASMESPRAADKEIAVKKRKKRKKRKKGLNISQALTMAMDLTKEQAEARIAELKVLITRARRRLGDLRRPGQRDHRSGGGALHGRVRGVRAGALRSSGSTARPPEAMSQSGARVARVPVSDGGEAMITEAQYLELMHRWDVLVANNLEMWGIATSEEAIERVETALVTACQELNIDRGDIPEESYYWVPREQNTEADALTKKA
jgi:hypothetical protein